MANRKITVDHLCRVEGHGGVTVELKDGKVDKVQMDIYEAMRYFEHFLKRVPYDQTASIACRICAICSAVHNIVSNQATEDAFGVKCSDQTNLLRRLYVAGGNIESHALHVYLLALPDLMEPRYHSALHMAQDLPEVAKIALDIKKCGNEIQDIVGGREIHACNTKLGGFGRIPKKDELKYLRDRLEKTLENAAATVPIVKGLDVPAYLKSENTYVGLVPYGDKFGYMGDKIAVSDGTVVDVHDYLNVTNEYVVPYSHAKFSAWKDKPFMVGAIARVHLFFDKLHPTAKAVAADIGYKPPIHNSLFNSVAQVLELVDAIADSIDVIDAVLAEYDGSPKDPVVKPKAGKGTAGIEAPRGTLYHSYEYDADGNCIGADIITPTCQNYGNMEKDIREMVENNPGFSDEDIHFHSEIIVRAYDPCISCSVHVINLDKQ